MTVHEAIENLKHIIDLWENDENMHSNSMDIEIDQEFIDTIYKAKTALEKQKNNGWIPCSDRLPEVETKVLILVKRKFRDSDFIYIMTTAMYGDGTVSECDSCWYWYDIYNDQVDDEVIAWQPLPEPYKESEEE